ncbi:hypothetical protein GCM10019059_44000 [Camelimonas fluminis]|nr:hypothetical protein GCM10019059_44000 [Camelimonas fluminis]
MFRKQPAYGPLCSHLGTLALVMTHTGPYAEVRALNSEETNSRFK